MASSNKLWFWIIIIIGILLLLGGIIGFIVKRKNIWWLWVILIIGIILIIAGLIWGFLRSKSNKPKGESSLQTMSNPKYISEECLIPGTKTQITSSSSSLKTQSEISKTPTKTETLIAQPSVLPSSQPAVQYSSKIPLDSDIECKINIRNPVISKVSSSNKLSL